MSTQFFRRKTEAHFVSASSESITAETKSKQSVSPAAWASSLFKRENPLAKKMPSERPVSGSFAPVREQPESMTHLRLLTHTLQRNKEGQEARALIERNAPHLYVRLRGKTVKVKRIVFESENGEDRFSQTFSYYPFKMTVMTEDQCFDYADLIVDPDGSLGFAAQDGKKQVVVYFYSGWDKRRSV